jgi:hypothetical protein
MWNALKQILIDLVWLLACAVQEETFWQSSVILKGTTAQLKGIIEWYITIMQDCEQTSSAPKGTGQNKYHLAESI